MKFSKGKSSILDPKEVNRARFGPRELKDPRSRQYAIQTIYFLKSLLESQRIDKERIEKELAEINEYQHWIVLGYPDLKTMLEAETGFSQKHFDKNEMKIIQDKKMFQENLVEIINEQFNQDYGFKIGHVKASLNKEGNFCLTIGPRDIEVSDSGELIGSGYNLKSPMVN